MPHFDIVKKSSPSETFRVKSVMGSYDMTAAHTEEHFVGDINLPQQWNIGLIVGRSGTGKSTHSRLWLEHISDTSLLNDDNPVVRFIDGEAIIYGTPWSGKTPCYKNESMSLKGVVRLSQAPYNKIARLAPLQAFASLMPACSCMRWDGRSVSALHKTVEKVIGVVPCWHLECLPDKDAAVLCNSTVKR